MSTQCQRCLLIQDLRNSKVRNHLLEMNEGSSEEVYYSSALQGREGENGEDRNGIGVGISDLECKIWKWSEKTVHRHHIFLQIERNCNYWRLVRLIILCFILLFVPIFIQQIFMKNLVIVRRCAMYLKYRNQHDRHSPRHNEFYTFWILKHSLSYNKRASFPCGGSVMM